MKTIGLTGGIGSGKSTVARLLKELGAVVIHADTVGHQVYLPDSEGWQRVKEAFGADILAADRTIDRKKLGAIVFGDRQALARLNGIVHPLILEETRKRIDALRAAGHARPVVVEAAVLIEANWLSLVDEVWLVVASKPAVIERLHRQRGLSDAEVIARVDAQLSDTERRRYAHVVIENTGGPEELRERVRSAWEDATAA